MNPIEIRPRRLKTLDFAIRPIQRVTFSAPPMKIPNSPEQIKGSLRKRFVGTAGWSLAGHFMAQVLRFGSNLILTRLLAPDLFGVMSVAYMVFTGIAMLSDIGLGAIASQSRRGNEPIFLNVLWVVGIVRGVAMTVIALLLGASLSIEAVRAWLPTHSVYGDPRVPLLIAVMALCGIIDGFQSTKIFWARRNLSIRTLTKMELAVQVATTAFILSWAFISPSIWALAVGWLFGELLRTVLSHLVLPGPPNRFEWDRTAFVEILDFGKWVLISSPLSFLLTSGDRLLLSAFLDAQAIGLYSIAVLLVVALQSAVLKVLGSAVQPALSEVVRDRPDELKKTIYRIRGPLGVACLVPAGALFMLGDTVIALLYDARYAGAGWMLSAVALTLAVTQLNVFDQCLIALGRIRRLSALNAIRLVALYTFVPLGYAMYGTRGAIGAIPAAALVNAVILLGMQHHMGLLDIRRELLALPLFLIGIFGGWFVKVAVT